MFNDGRIQQIGDAAEVYERPATTFVANFVGTSNSFDDDASSALFGRGGTHAIRPEKLVVHRGADGDGAAGSVAEVIYAGPVVRSVVDLDAGVRVSVLEQSVGGHASVERGERVRVAWRDADVRALEDESTEPAPATA